MAKDDDGIRLVRRDKLAAVLHPDTGQHVVPDPSLSYRADDPIVAAYPWMFGTADEIRSAMDAPAVESVEIESVERATRAPGERRDVTTMPRRGRPPKVS